MARVLAATVHLVDEDGTATVYPAGSRPPADAAEQITNPSAWTEEETEPPVKSPATPPVNDGQPPVSEEQPAGDEPARNGSTEAWKAYAEGLGQTVEPDAGRDAIIGQLSAAGLIRS